jgi:hypothetical protein
MKLQVTAEVVVLCADFKDSLLQELSEGDTLASPEH